MTTTDLTVPDIGTPEHLDLRRLPPVDHIDPPDRYSQTLLRHADTCKRAAYLYVKHHGGKPGHQLDRGTALHVAQAKATNLILEQYAMDRPAIGADIDWAVDEHTAKLLLDETFREHPELTVPLHERDDCRVMMVHLANGFPINPATVVAVERKFLIRLGGFTVSCVLDLASIDGAAGRVRDYKTEWDLPSQAEYEATFQGRLYAVALVYGEPVTRTDCAACDGHGERPIVPTHEGDGRPVLETDTCPDCDGHGYIEQAEPPIGGHLTTVNVGEVFPRFLQDDGLVPVRDKTLTRIEIDALRHDIENLCEQVAHAFSTDQFPAVDGSHCKRCPCEPECPLPRHLRNFAGTIETPEQAAEAAEWHQRVIGKLDATRNEIKSFCRVHGPLRFGTDQVWEFGEVERWETNWDGIEQGATRAAQYGDPFDMSDFRRRKLGTAFKARKLTDAELAAERDNDNDNDGSST